MEQEKEKSELLSFIDKYRLVRDDLVFYIHTSMEEVQSTCQKLELSGKIRVLSRELPLTCEEQQTDYVSEEFFTSVDKSTSNKFRCIDCG